MIPRTPAPESYTRFSCPNPQCAQFNRSGEDSIAYRSWTGKDKYIERLRCTVCGCEFSERAGTLMARSKLPEATAERLLKSQRWGVCDEGTTDICAVDLKTVYRFQRVATQRAVQHHQQSVQDVEVMGVQLDAAHSKLRPKQVEWVHTALAMGSWFLLWVDFGPRTQETAATLVAQVIARTRLLPLLLTDGWKAYTAALLQVVGRVYRPCRRGKVGRKPKPRLGAPNALFYAQVVKSRNKAGQVAEVSRRVVFGGPRRTPAMALGLTDHVRSYREYMWVPVHADPALDARMNQRIAQLLTPALQCSSSKSTRNKLPKREKSTPVPKAA